MSLENSQRSKMLQLEKFLELATCRVMLANIWL